MLFFFFFTISFFGILCSIVLLILNKVDKHANKLLALGLFNISVVLILNGLTYVDGFYLSYPHFYRLGICSQYLLAPFFYLYVRATINREGSFRKWDWLHFIPALLHFIEFIPFYLLPTVEKIAYLRFAFSHVEILSQQKEGLLPANVHPLLKTGTGILYSFFQVRLLFFSYKKKRKWLKKNKIVWIWIIKLTFFHSLTYIFVFFSIFLGTGIDVRIYSILSLGLVQLLCVITLLFNPRVLYGMNESEDVPEPLVIEDQTVRIPNKFSLSFVKKEKYKKELESFIATQKPYLKKKYAIREFAIDCNIPVHHLSIVINGEYGCNYPDFINNYRINFIIDHRYDEKWSSFSLEGLASEAGFNSRNSFLNAFKRVTGDTPTVYFAQKKIK
jgi:AraC-like DNA-binding protein